MYKNLKWRILLIFVMVLGAVALAYPLKDKIALGLDLQGGMHLVLEVKVEKAVEASLERLADDIKRDIGEEDLEVDRIKVIFENLQINIRMVDACIFRRKLSCNLSPSSWNGILNDRG